jgi:hypothetical protein
MSDPISWFTIEQGWDVVDRSGAHIGEVIGVVGDEDADIFDGLRFETSDGDERYVIAERVQEIVEGRVALDADLTELEALGDDDSEPGGAEISRDRDEEI